MKTAVYTRLALDGIKKNKRLYIPYIAGGAIMSAITYIMHFLASDRILDSIKKGAVTLGSILPLAGWIISVFSVIFLFYTNSFIIKRRSRELGLYNVLGMDKKNIAKVMAIESIAVAVMSTGSGIILGISVSKLAEAALLKALDEKIGFAVYVHLPAIGITAAVFAGIYLLLLVNALVRVALSKPASLIMSDKTGEKPPKGNGVLALIGLGLLIGAYTISLSIKAPLNALMLFFVAVVMVIVATYLLFISGSVTLCRLLRKNKNYYYNSKHFVSVSSMSYRMKRNGAGLASICILCTMVLVTVSATGSLYAGLEDTVKSAFPYQICADAQFNSYSDITDEFRREFIEQADFLECEDSVYYDCAASTGIIRNGDFSDSDEELVIYETDSADDIIELQLFSLSDYNRITGENETLADGECLVYSDKEAKKFDTFSIRGKKKLTVKKRLSGFFKLTGNVLSSGTPRVYLVVSDLEKYAAELVEVDNGLYDFMLLFRCGYDTVLSDKDSMDAGRELNGKIFSNIEMNHEKNGVVNTDVAWRQDFREECTELYTGIFFMGITLSVVFLIAAVLIIYYKQITEGHEDASRFDIMRKVGMTKKEIKRSINSQVLTVFFAPLVTAGVHMAFAMPIISKLLKLMYLENTALLIATAAGIFAVFALFYAVVYKITSHSYYSIVTPEK
ncbi:MAG: ABC transporter permease [Ruminococcus sp.]|nr:ABC transporter permease [Ruminococcus sp.]